MESLFRILECFRLRRRLDIGGIMAVCELVDQNENKHLHMIGCNDGEVVYCGVLGCDAL